MQKPTYLRLTFLMVITLLLISSCQPQHNTVTLPPVASGTDQDPPPNSTQGFAESATNPSSSESQSLTSSTPTQIGPTPTPIVETRLSPERWREWPVVPELTGREQAIYQL